MDVETVGNVAQEAKAGLEGTLVHHMDPGELTAGEMTLSTAAAGFVAQRFGSWPLIGIFLALTAAYLALNRWVHPFDPSLFYYTFAVSVLAILLSQIILLFQNRQSAIGERIDANAYRQIEELHRMEQVQDQTLEAMRGLLEEVHHLATRTDKLEQTADLDAVQAQENGR